MNTILTPIQFKAILIMALFFTFNNLQAQMWQNCNEMILTVDDFNTDLDFSNQPMDCGCSNNNGECTLVRVRMIETINGIETPVTYSSIGFMPPNTNAEVGHISKDYIDMYNPYLNCGEYQSQGTFNHSYRFSPVAPSGHEFHVLVCPGSEAGQMRGRFVGVTQGSTIAGPTNVQASDGDSGISVTFDSDPGMYYMAFRSTENCNESWTAIDPSNPWPQATGNTMTIDAQSAIPNEQFEYRVVASNTGFVLASDTEGAWSEPDLGHYGNNFTPFDTANSCFASGENCEIEVSITSDDCITAEIALVPNFLQEQLGAGINSGENCDLTNLMVYVDQTDIFILPVTLDAPDFYCLGLRGSLSDGTDCGDIEVCYEIIPPGIFIQQYLSTQPFVASDPSGTNVDFNPPVILDCLENVSISSTHVPGDFFPTGCTEVVHTITFPDGTTTDYVQTIHVTFQSSCNNDTEPPTCMNQTISLSGDINTGNAQINFADYFSDNCTENLFISGLNTTLGFDVDVIDFVPCGETYVYSMNAFDDAGNMANCEFTVSVDCGDDPPDGPCVIEPSFSNLLWSSFLGGTEDDEIVDIYLDVSTNIQYVIGKTSSGDFYSTNTVLGTSTGSLKTFVLAINDDASLRWSTLIEGWDDPQAISMDPSGYLTLVGLTDNGILPGSSNLPGYSKNYSGSRDVLILKLDDQGQNLVYSSFYGSGWQLGSCNDKLQVDFLDSKIYLAGVGSGDFSTNGLDPNGDGHIAVLDLTLANSTLLYGSQLMMTDSDCISLTALETGGFALIASSAGQIYQSLISPNAIENEFSNGDYGMIPTLFKFDASFNIDYVTNISPWRYFGEIIGPGEDATNGALGIYNYYQFELTSDNCGDLYWYSRSDGFRAPIFNSEYLSTSNLYRPDLTTFSDPNQITIGNPMLKINFSDNGNPFIESMLFFGYGGLNSTDSSFDVDDSGRMHFISRSDIFFNDAEIMLPSAANTNSDLYFIFENDLSDVGVQLINYEGQVLPIDIDVYDNKALIFGSLSEDLFSVTPSWTDENGNLNNIIQSNYGGGLSDAFISIIDNNELCEGCMEAEIMCDNAVIHFDGVNDKITAASPLTGNSDYTISLDFKGGFQTNGTYPRLIGFDGFQTEIGVRGDELSYYNGNSWRNSGVEVDDNIWRNVTLVRQASMNILYVDGELISSIAAPAGLNFSGNISIGGKTSGSNEFFIGSIDNVKVWNVALTSEQICGNVNTNSGSPNALFFNFEEGVGSENNSSISGPMDLAGGDNNGTFVEFGLSGDVSNYVCEDYNIACDFCNPDVTPPVFDCTFNWPEIVLESDGTAMLDLSTLDLMVSDDCGEVTITPNTIEVNCSDIISPGDPQVFQTLLATDESGNSSQCQVPIIVVDPNNYCVIEPCDNTALNFDGINDRLNLPNTHTGDVEFTLDAWFFSNNPTLVNGGNQEHRLFTLGTSNRLEIGDLDGNIWMFNGNGITTTPNIRDGQWHHLAIVRSGDRVLLYLDCVLIKNVTDPTVDISSNIRVGYFSNTTLFPQFMWKGNVDEIRMWDYAQSIDEIIRYKNCLVDPSTPGLVSHWRMEDGIGFANNTGVTNLVDEVTQAQGTIVDFDMLVDTSNFVCSPIIFEEECIEDPCASDVVVPFCSTIPTLNLTLNFNGGTSITPSMIDNGSFDECSEVTFELDNDFFTCADIGSNIVTLFVTDASGNQSSCTTVVVIEDKLAPTCLAQDITVDLSASGQVSISSAQIDGGSFDACGYTATLSQENFSCDDIGNVSVILTVSDPSGNSSSCASMVTINDPTGNCNPFCCDTQEVFNEALSSGYQINRNECTVTIQSPNLNSCYETIIDWGDGTSSNQAGTLQLSHIYSVDGVYEVCITTRQFNNTGEICNETSYCTNICVTCDQECQDEQLYNVSNYTKANHYNFGTTRKPSDVYFDGNQLYSSHVSENSDGSFTLYFERDGIVIHTIESDRYIQVSEIQIFDDEIYVTGSFNSPSLLVTSQNIDDNQVELNCNCYNLNTCAADGYVMKFDLNFKLIWAFSFGDFWRDAIEDITIFGQDDFAITGVTRLAVDFDPNDEAITESNEVNHIKSFVARYVPSTTNGQILPNCSWVHTLYLDDREGSNSRGLGIDHDQNGNIYAVGIYEANFLTNSALTLHHEFGNFNAPVTEVDFTVSPGIKNGYIAKYENSGSLTWIKNIEAEGKIDVRGNDMKEMFGEDIIIDDSYLYIGGRNYISKWDQNGVPTHEFYHDGLEINEITFWNENIAITGYVSDTYRSLSFFDPLNGPQIQEPLDMLFSVYDKDFNYLKSLNPGGQSARYYGLSISSNDTQIALNGYVLGSPGQLFYPDFPNIDATAATPTSLISDSDYFVGVYECGCVNFVDEMASSCCSNLSSQIKDDLDNEYCCSISINNNQGISISAIGIELLDADNSSFNVGELNLSDGFYFSNTSADYLEISHDSESIPQGNLSGLLDFCLVDANASSSGPQSYVISYIENLDDQEFISCTDTLIADCAQATQTFCVGVSGINAVCLNDNVHEVTFQVTNASPISVLTQLELSGLSDGFSFGVCGSDPVSINTSYTDEMLSLVQGESTEICVLIVSDRPINTNTQISFDAFFLDGLGKEFCSILDLSTVLEPCCLGCDDVQFTLNEIKPCCYSLDLAGICTGVFYEELTITGTDEFDLVNVEVNDDPADTKTPFELCNFDKTSICLSPLTGLIDNRPQLNIVTFCVANNSNDVNEVTFSLASKEDEDCEQTIGLDCALDQCVTEGFANPTLTGIGLEITNVKLECDQPPLILQCPTFSEIWVKGKFDCSENCTSTIESEIFLNGVSLQKKTYDTDGTWEMYLSDVTKLNGLYEIVVSGMCGDEMSSCVYSFTISQDCFDCSCSDFEKDLSNLFRINNYDGCEIGISPNSLKSCDTINSYSFNGDLITGPFFFEEEVFYDLPQKGDYEVCMSVTRIDMGGSTCTETICENYQLACTTDGVNGLFCEDEVINNGSFDEGVQGSMHENEKSNIPGWILTSGIGYYFESGGSGDLSSGFVQLINEDNVTPKLGFVFPPPEMEDAFVTGPSNEVNIFHDVKVIDPSTTYSINLIIGTDTLIEERSVGHENIWESKMVSFQPTDDQILLMEQGELELFISACPCDVPMTENISLVNVDNICIEFLKTPVSVIETQASDISVYPNPTLNKVFISDVSSINILQIFDVRGRIVEEVNTNDLKEEEYVDLYGLSEGIYIMKIGFEDESVRYEKIIKI